MSKMEKMIDVWLFRLIMGLFALMLALIPTFIYLSIQEQKEWKEFAADHDCKVVAAIRSALLPAQTGYACNDGVTYWR